MPPPLDPVALARRVRRAVAARARAARFARRVHLDHDGPSGVVPVGDVHAGGYLVPDGLLGPDSVVVSAGAGTDVSFESLLVDRFGCRVLLFDPVPAAYEFARTATAHEPRIEVARAALWSEDTELTFHAPEIAGHISHSATDLHTTAAVFSAPARSVASLCAEHGLDRVDLLKVSAEGSEYAVLDAVLADGVDVRAVCVEFAQPADVDRVAATVARWRGAGYAVVARTVAPFAWHMTFRRTAPGTP